jgi:hypothetical protein
VLVVARASAARFGTRLTRVSAGLRGGGMPPLRRSVSCVGNWATTSTVVVCNASYMSAVVCFPRPANPQCPLVLSPRESIAHFYLTRPLHLSLAAFPRPSSMHACTHECYVHARAHACMHTYEYIHACREAYVHAVSLPTQESRARTL